MENASKALIIAGAILLSILIISLGIMVYNNAKNTVGSANLSKQEIQAFNSQWETYVGENKTASEVRTMIQAAIASNAAESKGEGRKVTVSASKEGAGSEPTGTTAAGVTNGSKYTIEVSYDQTTGLVNTLRYYVPSGSGSGSTETPTDTH